MSNSKIKRKALERVTDWLWPFFPSCSFQHHRWQKRYHKPLIDLGNVGGESWRGIFSPQYDEADIQRYIHAQFRERAQTYAEKYTAIEYFAFLLSESFTKIGWEEKERTGLAILDLGSGAGNSIFPLLQLCPDSLTIASDLSLELLARLKESLAQQGLQERCAILQLNAEELDFAPHSFDLIVGAAVLHHLISPERTIRGCGRILKPGGYAIFFEPFENGNAILSLIYQEILRHVEKESIASEVQELLQTQARHHILRKGREKSSPPVRQMDDKWLFTKHHVEEMASQAGFSRCTIYSLHPTERQFEKQIEVILRLGVEKGREALPEWAWERIQQYDEFFSPDLKTDLLIEGGIILQK